MEGGEMKDARAGKWLEGLKKYRLAALAALLGRGGRALLDDGFVFGHSMLLCFK